MALELTVPVVTCQSGKAQPCTHTNTSCVPLTLNIYSLYLFLFISRHTCIVIIPGETSLLIVGSSYLFLFPVPHHPSPYSIFISPSVYFSHTVIISTIKQPAAAITQLLGYVKEEQGSKNKLYFSRNVETTARPL